MVQEKQFPGFAGVEDYLTDSLKHANKWFELQLQATMATASNLIKKIQSEKSKCLLSLPATLDGETSSWRYSFIIKELPKLTLLECIILTGVQKYQQPKVNQPGWESLRVKREEFFKHFRMGQSIEPEVSEIEKETNKFIKILPSINIIDEGFINFTVRCDFSQVP